ncbi:LPS export ABC transporter periplasmic protein LptC [Pontibacter sp. JAM-7]|uniref:LPS export ABC transporter periplasmic protein LptC n=1 Tax=Pontibacter sp. JAM-7 TaxID=3366581 RepID=UPI003AF96E64
MLAPRTAISMTAALLLALLFYWGTDSDNPQDFSADSLGLNRQMDYFINQVHLLQWQADGQLLRTSDSQRIEHYPEQQASQLSAPISHFYRQDGNIVRVTAESGMVPDDNKRIELAGDVVVLDNPGPTQGTRLNTEQLTIFPALKQADSNSRVVITHPDSTTEGVGMHADLDNGIIELHSRVKGTINHAQ